MTAAGTIERPTVSIIIPAWNKWDYTFRCLLSLVENTSGVAHETIVVDNASTDETATALPLLPGLRVLRNQENLGFARACNQGAALARGRYLLFLNNDTEALPDWLPPMVRTLESAPEVAIVGSKLLFPDGTLQHAGVAVAYASSLPVSPYHLLHHRPPDLSDKQLELSCVTAACMLIRAEVFQALGGFDEAFRNGYEDVDLCFKAREAGHRVVYTPESVLIHHESVSDGRFLNSSENEDLLNRRWMGRFTSFDADRRASRPAGPDPGARPPVSVLVPTKDSLRVIAVCLEDLADQLGSADQVVVVDQGSTDCTLQFVEQFSREHPGLVQILTCPRSSSSGQALRLGVEALRHQRCLVLHPGIRLGLSFTKQVVELLEQHGEQALACLPVTDVGFCAVGFSRILRRLAKGAPEVLFQCDVSLLKAGVERAGPVKLLLASPPEHA